MPQARLAQSKRGPTLFHPDCTLPRTMRFLLYKDLDLRRVKPTFAKVRAAIEANDFKSPDVKKLHVANY